MAGMQKASPGCPAIELAPVAELAHVTPLKLIGAGAENYLKAVVTPARAITQEMAHEVQVLRHRLGIDGDLRSDLSYLLGFHDELRRRPFAIFLRSGRDLHAVVSASELRAAGVPSGTYLIGDIVGDGPVIGEPCNTGRYLSVAAKALLEQRPLAHTIRACVNTGGDDWVMSADGIEPVSIRRRSIRRRLALAETFPKMLLRFGIHTRRHLQRKRVILESQHRSRFSPRLNPREAFETMVALADSSLPRRSLQQHRKRYELLSVRPSAFAMALQEPRGDWLSFLSGWRSQRRTYIDLQMNNGRFPNDSVSAVMRSYMLEHEIGLGQTDVVFVGGSSVMLQRYCEEDEECVDLLFQQEGIRSVLSRRLLQHIASRPLVDYIYFDGSSA